MATPEERPAPQPRSGRGGPDRREAAIATLLAATAILLLLVVGLALRGSAGAGYDLDAYLAAAARVAAGGTPYQPETLGGPFRPGPGGLYLYPPPLAILLAPFAGLPRDVLVVGWLAARIAVLALGCLIMPVRPIVRGATLLVAAFSYPVLLDLNLGNVSLLVLVLTAVGWRFLDRPAGSVALAIVLAVRPPLLAVPAWQALRRRWRPVAWTILAGLTLVLVTLPLVGSRAYADFLTVARNLSGFIGVPRNVDLGSMAAAAGLQPPLPIVAYAAGALLGLAIIVVTVRLDRAAGYVATVGASLLLAPLLWPHYLVALLLPAALLADRGRWPGILLPLLAWLPEPLLPYVAIVGAVAPLLVGRRGEAAAAD